MPQACMTLSRVPCTWDSLALLLQLLDMLANNRKNDNWINLQLNWIINFSVLSLLVLLLNLTVCLSSHVRKPPHNCPSYPKLKVPLSRQKHSWVRKQVWQGNFVSMPQREFCRKAGSSGNFSNSSKFCSIDIYIYNILMSIYIYREREICVRL